MSSQAIEDRVPRPVQVAPAPAQAAPPRPRHRGLFDPKIVRQAVLEAFVKLDPRRGTARSLTVHRRCCKCAIAVWSTPAS
jgi:hypothetical protein